MFLPPDPGEWHTSSAKGEVYLNDREFCSSPNGDSLEQSIWTFVAKGVVKNSGDSVDDADSSVILVTRRKTVHQLKKQRKG